MDAKSLSFIRFQCILLESGVPFSDFWNFCKLKRENLISGGNQFCRKSELFGPPLLYFNFKSFKDPNSLSYMRTLLFFRWYIVLSYLSVPWESLIVFLLKDAGDSLLHLSAFFCIERLSSTRLLDIVLIITILFFIFTGEFSRRYSYDRLLPGYVVNLQVWMLVLKCDFNKLTMKFSWNYISTGQQSNGFALYF